MSPRRTVLEKRCYHCGEVKPTSEFYPHRDTRDRLQSYCKDCMKAATQESNRRNHHEWRKAKDARAKWAAIAAEAAASE
jgi:hypothetical protein